MTDAGKRVQIPKGALILREGEVQSCAYEIVSGSVVVFKAMDDQEVALASLGPGEVFGEMALVSETPRSASVRALEDCELNEMDQEGFNRMLSEDPKRLRPLLRTLFERLRLMNLKYVHAIRRQQTRPRQQGGRKQMPTRPQLVVAVAAAEERDLEGQQIELTIRAMSSQPLEAEGRTEWTVDKLPYRIGREQPGSSDDVFALNDLMLVDNAPFQVSRNHCALDLTAEGDVFIQDRGSTLGTIVNDKALGAEFNTLNAILVDGDNIIILGTPGSPFRLCVTVHRQDPEVED